MKMKHLPKMSTMFELSTIKLRYQFLWKFWKKNTWHMFYWFLTNRSKIEDGKEKKLEKQNNF